MVALIGAVISLLGFLPYQIAAIKGRANPHVITWVVLAFVGIVNAHVLYLNGGPWVLATAFATGRTITCIISFHFGTSRVESRMTALSIFIATTLGLTDGLVTSLAWQNDILSSLKFMQFSIVITILIEFFGVVPAIEYAYKHAHENLTGWWFFLIGSIITLTQLEYSFWIVLYPVWATLLTASVIAVVIIGRHSNRAQQTSVIQ